MRSLLKEILLMHWLWQIFAGFYLVAYTFWAPTIFTNIPMILLAGGVTLIVGLCLLYSGFQRALILDRKRELPSIPRIRLWWLIGGLILLAYVQVYLPPGGRIVPHWPLDLAITIASGIILIVYSARERTYRSRTITGS